jgi:hypothetical protein
MLKDLVLFYVDWTKFHPNRFERNFYPFDEAEEYCCLMENVIDPPLPNCFMVVPSYVGSLE